MKLVVIESPYAANEHKSVETHLDYRGMISAIKRHWAVGVPIQVRALYRAVDTSDYAHLGEVMCSLGDA